MNLSVATGVHAAQIRDIYAPFVREGYVTFETEVPGIESFKERIERCTLKYPWLVMEADRKVLGYAYASAYRERVAYQWVAECSVYVCAEQRKKGIAAQLYKALFELLRLQGIYKVYAVITIPNPQSIGFHEAMGFNWFATYQNVGFKAGKWCDVGWWQLTLTEPDASVPSAPLLFPQLAPSVVENTLKRHAIR